MMIRALLLDVDGTLYHQRPLQALMAAELAVQPVVSGRFWRAPKLWRMLSTFRHVREELRARGAVSEPLADLQYTAAADRAGVDADEMRRIVSEWIYRRPLKYLTRVRRHATVDVLSGLRARGLQVGVFSDYPAMDKLTAMGLRPHVTLALDATDERVNAFKPHPRGLLAACEAWGLAPDEVLYVGDRPDVDAGCASRAGMPCAIFVKSRPADAGSFVAIKTMPELTALVGDGSRR